MKETSSALLFIFLTVFSFADDKTEIKFFTNGDTAVYLMNSLIVDTRTSSLVKDFDIYIKELQILGIAPFTATLANGVYQFAVIDNKNTITFPVKAEGGKIEVHIKKAPPFHDVLLYSFVASTIVSAVSFENSVNSDNIRFSDNILSYVGISAAAISVSAIIWWLATMPGVKVKTVK
jgi:hypothetical protein